MSTHLYPLVHHSDSFLPFFSSLVSLHLSFPPSLFPSFLLFPFPPSFPHFPSFLPFSPPTPTPTPSSPHSIPTHLPETQVGTGTGKVLKVPIEVSAGIFF